MTTTSTTAADLWHRISATAPAPGLGLVLATLTVALAGTALPEVWRWTRHVVTVAHEGAHGVAAVLSGRRLAGIRLHSDSSGLTVSAGRSTGVGMVLTAAAGYVGPGLAGLGVAAVVSRGHALAALWLLLVLLAWMLLQIRSLFGLWYVAAAGGAVFAVTWWASGHVQTLVAYTVTWFLLLGAPRAVVELHRSRRGRRDRTSDAATLARLTGLPGLLWVGFFLAVTLGVPAARRQTARGRGALAGRGHGAVRGETGAGHVCCGTGGGRPEVGCRGSGVATTRLAPEPALPLDPEADEGVVLRLRLDALDDAGDPHRVGHRDDASDDGRGGAVVASPGRNPDAAAGWC